MIPAKIVIMTINDRIDIIYYDELTLRVIVYPLKYVMILSPDYCDE